MWRVGAAAAPKKRVGGRHQGRKLESTLDFIENARDSLLGPVCSPRVIILGQEVM